MVDVSAKRETEREAIAECEILMSREAARAIQRGAVKKGDPLQAARLAGILAAKRTADLIPLCHQIPLSVVDVEIQVRPRGCRIRGRAVTVARTGVEMEALVAALVAALTIYDMVKAVDRTMVIGPARLLEKRGGRSGHYRRA
jgi:cyclic pyranopterin phosphate synthase